MNAQPQNLPAVIAAVEARITSFASVLPPNIPATRFVASFKTMALTHPEVLKADPRSVVIAVMQAAQDGLLPDGRDAAIVVRKGVAQYQRMVGGLIKLLYRTGLVSTVAVEVVREGDQFDWGAGDEPFISHKPTLRGGGDILAAYSILTMADGTKSRCLMGWDEIETIMKGSPQGWDRETQQPKGIWKLHPGEMAKKTVLHRHVKIAPLEGMPIPLDGDEVAQIEDAAWTEPEDFTRQPAEPERRAEPAKRGNTTTIEGKANTTTPETPTSRTEATTDEVKYWRGELRGLRDALAKTTTLEAAEDAYIEWDAAHETIPDDAQAVVKQLVDARVAILKAELDARVRSEAESLPDELAVGQQAGRAAAADDYAAITNGE